MRKCFKLNDKEQPIKNCNIQLKHCIEKHYGFRDVLNYIAHCQRKCIGISFHLMKPEERVAYLTQRKKMKEKNK